VRNKRGAGVVAAAGLAAVVFGTGAIASAATSTNGDALTKYGSARVRVPYSRIYAFKAECAALPCKIRLGQHFYAGHTALRALRELEPGPIKMNQNSSPGHPWVTWYVKRDFNQKLLRADLAKYHRLTLKLTASITDAKGGSATAKRTITLVPAPLPLFIAGSYRGRRPSTIDISGDAGNIVTHLHWTTWTASYARGSGTSNIQGCVPNCATGSETPVATSITLKNPSSRGYFTKLIEHRNGQTETFTYTPGHYPDDWPGGAS
jgi:hypothetical protein